jgi:RNA-directed DNA polymerase
MEQRGGVMGPRAEANQKWEERMNEAKPFEISKKEVWEAYEKVKSNKGAAGVDGQTIADFEEELKDNLYLIWNRMSSGSYFPPAVRVVEIPKDTGGTRKLGIANVADRIAQTVATSRLVALLDPLFHPDSYAYRAGKSALDAVAKARQRCWENDWVIDLDIKGFFDTIDWELLLRAVNKHVKDEWLILYIERWLKAPEQDAQGQIHERVRGSPQGGVVSPVLANLFLHYAFDMWMKREYPQVQFERYADDVIVHCKTQAQATEVLAAIDVRMRECKLELHPEKTKIVYCKDANRKGAYPQEKFTFLGYEFRQRQVKTRKGTLFMGFNPAIAPKARQAVREEIRRWGLPLRSDLSLEEISKKHNPAVRGWLRYYGRFNRGELYHTLGTLQYALARWASRKFKTLKHHIRKASRWIAQVSRREFKLFAHWELVSKRGSMMGAV